MKRRRRNHGADFAALKGDKTLAELAAQFGVHPTQITEWKPHVPARTFNVFGGAKATSGAPNLTVLHRKTVVAGVGHDFRKGTLIKVGWLSAME